jgi:hypothetical protein
MRPASVQKVELVSGGSRRLQFVAKIKAKPSARAGSWTLRPAAFAFPQNGWWRANTEHPTTSVWSRWRKVEDWDGHELAQKFPAWAMECHGVRATATNHFMAMAGGLVHSA